MGFVGPSPLHTGHSTYRYIVSYEGSVISGRHPQSVKHRVVVWAYSAEEALFQIREPIERQQKEENSKEWFRDFKVEPFPENPHGCTCPVRQSNQVRGTTVAGEGGYVVDKEGAVHWYCAEHGANGHWQTETEYR